MTLAKDRRRKERRRDKRAMASKPASAAQRSLLAKLLAARPLIRLALQPRLERPVSAQQASELIDWLRAGAKYRMPDLSEVPPA